MAIYVESGVTSNDLVVQRNNVTVFEGGIVSNTTINEFGRVVLSGGSADNTTINSGGSMVVTLVGTAVSTTVNSGGYMGIANNNASALEIKENGGYVQANEILVHRGNVSFVSNTISGLTLSGTSMTVHSNTVADGIVIDASGVMQVFSSGIAKNTAINANGSMILSSYAIHQGTLQIESGAVVSASGTIDFTVADRTKEDGYLINDLSLIQGTPTYTITVSENQAGGTYKLAQGAASFTGTLTIRTVDTNYGSITVNGDDFVYNGVTYSLDQVDGNLTMTVIPKPAVFIYEANKYLVSSYYEMTGAVVDSNHTMRISSGGVANETTLNSGAYMYIFSGGVANDTTVNSTGRMHLVAGTASNTTVNAYGRMFMSSGAIHRGTLQLESGATVNAYEGIIDFTVADRTVEDDYLINDLSRIRDNPIFTITVSENQTAGTYKLAQGASSFLNIAISIGTEDTVYGSVTVNGSDFVYDGISYSLDQVNGDLSLTITDTEIATDFIVSGETVTGAIIGSQIDMFISSGGTANSTTVNPGGNIYIRSNGVANNTTVNSNGAVYIDYDGVASDTILNGHMAISDNGVANNTTVNAGGDIFINHNAVVNDTTLNSRGSLEVYGGTANSTTVNSDADMYIRFNGKANDTIVNASGSMFVYGVANNTIVNSYGFISISLGGVANDTTVNTYGSMHIRSGGTANRTTISRGSMYISSGGVANDTIFKVYGSMYISEGGVANNTTLNGKGCIYISEGGVANSTTMSSGGHIYISEGGVANSTAINSLGNMRISNGGVANHTTISHGSMYISSGGVANNTIVISSLVGPDSGAIMNNTTLNDCGSMGVRNGGVANSTTINTQGQMVVFSDGVANSTTINTQGQMVVSSDGVANSTTINSAGEMILSSGAVANNTIVNAGATMSIGYGGKHGGTLQMEAGAIVYANTSATLDFTVAGRTVEDDYLINNLSLIRGIPTYTITVSENQEEGTYKLAQGASSFSGRTMSIGTADSVWGSVTVNGEDFIYNNSIVYSLNQVDGNLTLSVTDMSAVFIYDGGNLVSSGITISGAVISGKNNFMDVTSGGTASDTTINFRGNVYAYDGGYVVGTVVNSMGNLTLENAVADSSLINTGGQLLTGPNATINHTDVAGGTVFIYDASCVANDTVIRNGGMLSIEKGSALVTEVSSNGVLLLSNGAVAKDTTFADGGAGVVLDGAVISGTMISNGALTVSGGGSALNTTVASNGYVYLADDGLINNLDIQAGGTLCILEGTENSIASGILMVAGKVIAENDVTGDYSIVWSLEDAQPGNEVMIEGLSHFAAADFFISVSADQAAGTYSLADGFSVSMANISITIGSGATSYGSVAVNGAGVVYNGLTYAVNEANGNLTLFIGDITPPDKPAVTASTTAFTNQDVTLTAAFTEDSAVKQYKIGNGEWQAYTGAVTVTENATVYFRAADEAGNISDVTEYVVSNIDKVAPTLEIQGNAANWTNKDVTLTAVVSDGIVEYFDGSAWVEGANLTVSENGTYRFRVTDAAGNVTEQSVIVDKIDKVAPTLEIRGVTSTWTNKDVTLTAVVSDGVVEYYDGSAWVEGANFVVSENGTYRFRVTDAAGNVTEQSATVGNIDKVAPTVPEISVSNVGKKVTLSHNGAKDDGSGIYRYLIEISKSEDFSTIDYHYAYIGSNSYNKIFLPDGIYYFRMKVEDNVGNVSAYGNVVSLTVDTTPPEKPEAGADITSVTNKAVTVTASFSNDTAVMEYSYDNQTWEAYTAGIVFDDNGVVYFRGQDAYGNISEVTEYVVSNIDKVAPLQPTAAADITGIINKDVTITATFSGDSAVKQYKIGNGEWLAYTGAVTVAENATLYFRAADAAGNISEVTEYVVSNIDKVAPTQPTAAADITGITNKAVTITATFSGDSAVKQYKIGNGEWLAYTGAVTVAENATVYFRAADEAGNISDITEYVVSNIDRIAPDQPTAAADITGITNKDVTITATYTADSAVKQYKIGNGEWLAYTGAVTVTENATVYFRAADEAGNISEVTEYVVSNIDKVAPTQPTAAADITKVTNQDVTITATFSGDSAVKQYKIGNGEWLAYTGAVTVSENATLYFRASDEAGNISEVTEYVVSNIDKVVPTQPTASADITGITNKDVTITATFSGDSAVKQYKIGNGEWLAYTGAVTVSENATLYFRASDEAGNISEVTEYVVSNIDKVAPTQPTADADIKETTYDSVTITATFSGDSAVKQYKIGNGEWLTYTDAVTVSENATVYFRALDEAGNISEVTEYVVDNIIKSVTLDGSGMTHEEAIAAGCELIVTTSGTYKSNIGHDGVEARIEGGTFSCTVSGGALTSSNNYMTWDDQEADTNLSISGGTFNKVVMGGDRVNYGNCEHIGDLNLTINGGMFNSQIVGGMAYTDQSIRGQALLTGDINMTLAGGTFKSRIYGGCISTTNYSTRTAIEGDINIIVDSSENELIFADNVYIVAGSYQSGAVYGNVQVTFTGLGENLKMDADNLVWGGSSSDVYLIRGNTRTFQSTISGTRTICFNDFTGEFNTGIRGFNIFTAENGSKLEILASNHLRDIEQWNLDWDTQLSGAFQNDFKGDTMNIDLTGWDQTATDLFDCAAGTFTGFEAMKKVTLGGETATYSDAISGYVSTNYMLTLRDNQTMQLSMNTTLA